MPFMRKLKWHLEGKANYIFVCFITTCLGRYELFIGYSMLFFIFWNYSMLFFLTLGLLYMWLVTNS